MPDHPTASGTAAILGAAALIVTMAFHPTGHDLHGSDPAAALRTAEYAHALGIASVVAITYGAFGLSRRLRAASPATADLAFTCHAFAAFAGMFAALASGFVAARAFAAAHAADAKEQPLLDAIGHAAGLWNQACAGAYVLLSCAAIALWAAGALRHRALPRLLGGFGLAAALLIAALFGVGHLRLDVHGFGAVALAQALWWIGCGVVLRRRPPPA